jgi:hypothetical protein
LGPLPNTIGEYCTRCAEQPVDDPAANTGMTTVNPGYYNVFSHLNHTGGPWATWPE